MTRQLETPLKVHGNLKVAEHSFSMRFSLSVVMQCSLRNKHGADTALIFFLLTVNWF